MPKCLKCENQILFIKTVVGKLIPVEVKLLTCITPDGVVVKGHEPHWANCPAANEFRKNAKNISRK